MGTGLIGKPTPPLTPLPGPDEAIIGTAAGGQGNLFWEVSAAFCIAFLLALGVLLLWHP